ncbi:MAG: response regulator, partial [Candidatus Obscuribacterales bacterium]|nr:response regulator [Steroidobacteraceae bacterium]
EQLVGKPFDELLPDKDRCLTLLDQVFRTKKSVSHTEQDSSKSHAVFWSYTIWPVQEKAGLVGIMIQVTESTDAHENTVAMNEALLLSSMRQHELTAAADEINILLQAEIVERKQVEKALSELHHRKDEFLAMLSHELRNPLAPIANSVQVLRFYDSKEPNQLRALNIIERQVSQLKHLVDDLMEVSRFTTGRIQLRKDQISLSHIVERAIETTRPLIEQRRHAMQVTLPSKPIWLHADAARLEQVLINLLTNAAKYTDEGGQLWLTAETEGEMVAVRVKDTGVGIAPDLLPHIFELFTQAERSIDRSLGGLGIGLCLVQRLVELHGGSVEAQSVLGEGSEFVVRLPMLTSEPLSPQTFILESTQLAQARRVLIVEDNVDAAQSLAILLAASGHDVRVSHDGPTAVEAALDHPPDVVLLDIGLPGFDGYEVARRMREQPILGNVELVALTGYGRSSDLQRAHDAGFDHHLVKPANFEQIKQILASHSNKMQLLEH